MMNSWEKLAKHFEEQQTLSQILELISWDQETYMPQKSIGNRSKQVGFISGLLHQKKTNPELKELLTELTPQNPTQKASLENEKRMLEEIQKLSSQKGN